jgi:hypothetical protein
MLISKKLKNRLYGARAPKRFSVTQMSWPVGRQGALAHATESKSGQVTSTTTAAWPEPEQPKQKHVWALGSGHRRAQIHRARARPETHTLTRGPHPSLLIRQQPAPSRSKPFRLPCFTQSSAVLRAPNPTHHTPPLSRSLHPQATPPPPQSAPSARPMVMPLTLAPPRFPPSPLPAGGVSRAAIPAADSVGVWVGGVCSVRFVAAILVECWWLRCAWVESVCSLLVSAWVGGLGFLGEVGFSGAFRVMRMRETITGCFA